MVLSYMEETISKFYKAKGYLVPHRVMYKVTDKKKDVVKDIDILAINDKEAIIIGCRPYTGHVEVKGTVSTIVTEFNSAEKSIKDIPMLKGKKIVKMLVAEEPIPKLDAELKKNGINVYLLEELMMDFLILLLQKHKGKRVDSRTNDIIRNLIFSIIEEKA